MSNFKWIVDLNFLSQIKLSSVILLCVFAGVLIATVALIKKELKKKDRDEI